MNVIIDNLMFWKKKKKTFKIPKTEIKVKVLGHIDLDAINQKTKPERIKSESKINKEKKALEKAKDDLNINYNGIVNLLELYQLCDLRDSLNRYINLQQRIDKYGENND